MVLRCEAGFNAIFVLEEATVEVAGNAGVESTGGAAENINAAFGHGWLHEGELEFCGRKVRSEWVRSSVSGSFASLRMTAKTDNSKNRQQQKQTTTKTNNSKNKQQQKQTTAKTDNGKNRQRLKQTTASSAAKTCPG